MKANKDSTISYPITMMLSVLIVGAPYLLRATLILLSSGNELDLDDEMDLSPVRPVMFQNTWQQNTETVMLLPLFLQTMLNLMLFQSMKIYLKRRMLMKQMLMCMLEPELADTYDLEALPALELDEENLSKFFKLYKFTRTYNRKFF